MRPEALEAALAGVDGPAIVCAQVGEVNTGAVDAMPEIAASRRRPEAWLHVDGAFGLWAAASPELRQLVDGSGARPTRGRRTRTSGSTSRTTAGSRSSPIRKPTARPWR